MKTDVLERIEDLSEAWRSGAEPGATGLWCEAADEIRSLRTENSNLHDELRQAKALLKEGQEIMKELIER